MKKNYLLLIVFVFLTFTLFSQSKIVKKANQEYIEGNFDKAEEIYLKGLSKYPNDSLMLISYAHFCRDTKKHSNAKNYYKKILSLMECLTCVNNLGIVEFREGNFEKALGYYNNYLRAKPQDIIVQLNKLYCLFNMTQNGNYAEYLIEYDLTKKLLYDNFEKLKGSVKARKRYYEILIRETTPLIDKINMDGFYKSENKYDFYSKVDIENLEKIRSNIHILLNINFIDGKKEPPIKPKSGLSHYVYDTMKKKAKTEFKVEVSDERKVGQYDLILLIDKKIDDLTDFGVYRPRSSRPKDKLIANMISDIPYLEKDRYGLTIDGSLPIEEIKYLLYKVTESRVYRRYRSLMDFKNELSDFFGYNHYKSDIVYVGEYLNRIDLNKEEIAQINKKDLSNLTGDYSKDFGFNCSYMYINIRFKPSEYSIREDITEKDKFSYGGITGTSGTYSERLIKLEPQNKVSFEDLNNAKMVFEEVFNKKLTIANSISLGNGRDWPTNDIENYHQHLTIRAVLDSDSWTFKEGFKSFIKMIGYSDDGNTTNFSTTDGKCYDESEWNTTQWGFGFNAKKKVVKCLRNNNYEKEIIHIGDENRFMVYSGLSHENFSDYPSALEFVLKRLNCGCN